MKPPYEVSTRCGVRFVCRTYNDAAKLRRGLERLGARTTPVRKERERHA